MAIIKYDPFNEMENMFDDFFGGRDFIPLVPTVNKFTPPINMYDDKENVYIDVALSGYSPENIDIQVENGILTLKGNIEKKREIDEKNYYRKEIRSGSFMRQVALPSDVQGDRAEANVENGILKISIPKKDEAKPKKIAIKINKK